MEAATSTPRSTTTGVHAPALLRTGLSDQIREFIIDGIVTGRWQPGERVIERRIASELGVSQGPVREALRQLEAQRLVVSAPGRGASVRQFTEEDLAEIFPVRAGLEQTAAELAVPRMAGHVEALERHNERLAEAASAGNTAAQLRHSIAFHHEIVVASGNRLLLSVWESLGIEIWTTLSLRLHNTEIREKSAEHARIVEAIRCQDPAAPGMLHDHVLNYAPDRS